MRREVLFKTRSPPSPVGQPSSPSVSLEKLLSHTKEPLERNPASAPSSPATDEYRVEEASSSEVDEELPSAIRPIMTDQPSIPLVPELFSSLPLLRDALDTETSISQEEIAEGCLQCLSGQKISGGQSIGLNAHGVPRLNRQKHISFLHGSLGRLPAGFVAADASRPWMLYWALTGLHLLGEDVSEYRDRAISTLRPMQNSDGGFGGGHGQMSHLAPSYAAVLTLILVGGIEALELINRKALLVRPDIEQRNKVPANMSLADGRGEEDVRGAYCAMVLITLLDLPVELTSTSPAYGKPHRTLTDGLTDYLSRCQTFEGGISGSPGNEAHGAYAFCALACFCMLGQPQKMLSDHLDLPRLVSWLSARQYAPEGGFAGRTNKLVDGCYSHWVGGCWPLIDAALDGSQAYPGTEQTRSKGLCSRDGLVRYIMCCCQSEQGGLRDKPGKRPDSYHSCYVLAGLSSAQNSYFFAEPHGPDALACPALRWVSRAVDQTRLDGAMSAPIFEEADRVSQIHPIFVLPWGASERARGYFAAKSGF